ncbi:MAG: tetratricopeptide repeat protein [Bacteroidales bacterium]|nr:tetratricopeptide repeat protein [Bacteroidales bacterium]
MKKLIIIVATLLAAASVYAQDMATLTETYNSAITANEAGNVELALQTFKDALVMAEALGEEGAEIAANCKTSIPILTFSLAKKAANAAEYDKAVSGLKETIEVANKYGAENIADEATVLIPQVLMQKANGFFNDKDYAGAADAYKAVLAEDANNGMASLRLGAALKSLGDKDGAVEAFQAAIANGQDKAASKQLVNLYQQDAKASLKAKKYDDAIASALESVKYGETPTAYQIAGTAASNGGKTKQAIEFFEKYIELAPNAKNSGDILFSIAVSYQQLKDTAKAKDYYHKAVADPNKISQKNLEAAKAQLAAIK